MSYGIGSDPLEPDSPGESTPGHGEGSGGNDHLALIYGDRGDQLATVASFIRRGLERGERCLYIADDNTTEEVLDALAAAGVDTGVARDSGALSIHSAEETYLDGGTFDREEMLRLWDRSLERARDRREFDGLRAAAEMTWALDSDTDLDDLAAYEALLNRLYDGEDYTVLCQYNRDRFPSETIADVIRTHPLVVEEDAVRRNAHYRPPGEFFDADERWTDRREESTAASDSSSKGSAASAGPDPSRTSAPMSSPVPDAGSAPPADRDPVAARPVRVLYVDDEPGYAETAAEFLELDDGIDAVVAETSPRNAVDRLEEGSFDCVVSDYDMPAIDGLELLEAVRERRPDVPFILVTGRGDEAVASEAISAGVTDYLRKQPGTDQYVVLANRVRNAVEQHRAEREIERTRRWYRRLIEASTDVIVVLDTEGRFEYLSPAAERRLGHPAAELVGETAFEYVHPDDVSTVRERFAALAEGSRQQLSVEFRFERGDGSWTWLEVRARDALDDPDVGGIIAYGRDVSERKEHEQALRESERRFRSLFEEAFDGMVIVDDDARCVAANPAACELFELSPDALRGRSVAGFVPDDEFATAWGRVLTAASESPASERSASGRETVRFVGAEGTERFVEFAVTPNAVPGPESDPDAEPASNSDRHLLVLRDVTDRERHERTLTALHDSSRELLEAETETDVAESIVGTVTGLLSLSAAAVYLFDPTDGELVPTAAGGHDGDGSPAPVTPDGSTVIGATFLEGEPRAVGNAEVRESPSLPFPPSQLTGGLVLPLGDHGVCVVVDEESPPTGADRELVEILAAAAETALDRIERDAELREREAQLESRTRTLEQLNQLNGTIREIDRALARADTRSEIETVVCEHLSASDGIALASIAEYDAGDDRLVLRKWDGDEAVGRYLDAASSWTDGNDPEPSVRADLDREPVYEGNVAADLGDADWRTAALSSGVRSALSVPLTYRGISYGALTVYATRDGFFDELSRTALIDLSNRVANVVNAVEHQNAVLSETTTEVKIRLADESVPLYRVATTVGCSLDLETTTPRSDGQVSIRVGVEGAPPSRVVEAAEAVAAVSEASVVSRGESGDDDTGVVELRFSGTPLADCLADRGIRVASYTADRGSATVTLLVPDTVDVEWVFDELRDRYSDPELLAKRRRSRADPPSPSGRDPAETYRSELTPRQQEVLRTAYLSGYFRSPRECTGEDLADRLDVSPQTVYRHIRAAERRLFEALFEGTCE